jgi:hypothetical protein
MMQLQNWYAEYTTRTYCKSKKDNLFYSYSAYKNYHLAQQYFLLLNSKCISFCGLLLDKRSTSKTQKNY